MKAFAIRMILLAVAVIAVNWAAEALAQSPRTGIAHRAASRAASRENRWRYVWHNDRWWYWTADGRWDYFDGRRWKVFDPRRPPSDALALGYRRAPAFERPPGAAPRPPLAWSGEGLKAEAGLIDLYDLGRQGDGGAVRFGGGALPAIGGGGTGGTGLGEAGSGARGGGVGGTGGMIGGRGTRPTGGGGFGGPTGGSLGAGSAAGGASSPQ
jgi:hypothetical protein